MTDSLKLAVASVITCTLASLGWLAKLGGAGQTAAFLLYLVWPGLSLALAAITLVFAIRELRKATRWGPWLAIVISLAVVGFSWTQFHGWE